MNYTGGKNREEDGVNRKGKEHGKKKTEARDRKPP